MADEDFNEDDIIGNDSIDTRDDNHKNKKNNAGVDVENLINVSEEKKIEFDGMKWNKNIWYFKFEFFTFYVFIFTLMYIIQYMLIILFFNDLFNLYCYF